MIPLYRVIVRSTNVDGVGSIAFAFLVAKGLSASYHGNGMESLSANEVPIGEIHLTQNIYLLHLSPSLLVVRLEGSSLPLLLSLRLLYRPSSLSILIPHPTLR